MTSRPEPKRWESAQDGESESPARRSSGRRGFQEAVKRGFDIVAGLAALLLTAPLTLLSMAAIYLEDGRPVLFVQVRGGRHGRPFRLYKLRSMRLHRDAPQAIGQVRPDHPLVLKVGRPLRRFKLDELPQLWNVLKGDMSLVGPRPTLMEQVERYDDFQRQRLDVPPGCTGWPQVNGGTLLSWEDRIRLDVWYVRNWSLGLDLAILMKTIGTILLGERECTEAVEIARDQARDAERYGSDRPDGSGPAV